MIAEKNLLKEMSWIEDGKICAVGVDLRSRRTEVIDAEGLAYRVRVRGGPPSYRVDVLRDWLVRGREITVNSTIW